MKIFTGTIVSPFLGLLGLLAGSLVEAQAVAQTAAAVKTNDTLNPSDPPRTKYQLTPTLSTGSTIEIKLERRKNLDLDRTRDDRSMFLEPEVEIAFAYVPGPNFQAFLNFELSQEFALDEPEKEKRRLAVDLDLAYVTLKTPAGERLTFQVGRQKYEDEREWLFDEKLDAVRAFYRFPNLLLDLSASRQNIFDRDLVNSDHPERINNYHFSATTELTKEAILSFYAFGRNDRSADRQSPIFYGLHSSGDITKNLEYWVELAHVRGRDGSRKIRAYGFDIGATYEFNLPLEPSLTLGYAFGSGDADPADRIDRNFRQTGLQDNEARFNGVASFQYYGEAFDPELSNMGILTVGAGIRPTKQTSIDLVYHRYRQHKASDSIRDSALDADPSGLSRKLGSEIDLVLGYRKREGRRVSALLTLGYFKPGNAFPADAAKGAFLRFELKTEF